MEVDEYGNQHFNIFSDSPDNLKKDLGTKSMMFGADKNYFIWQSFVNFIIPFLLVKFTKNLIEVTHIQTK